jgi:hypothetical protein
VPQDESEATFQKRHKRPDLSKMSAADVSGVSLLQSTAAPGTIVREVGRALRCDWNEVVSAVSCPFAKLARE